MTITGTRTKKLQLSCEFFPPRSDTGSSQLQQTHRELCHLQPEFFSVTYGAGGSTHDSTREAVLQIQQQSGNAAAHLSFTGESDRQHVEELLQQYRAAGVRRIVALRGDVPGRGDRSGRVHADELVRFIRACTGDHFHIAVAAYPEMHPDAGCFSEDIGYLKQKLDAGADSAITQFFFNIDAWHYFMDRCRSLGIRQPIYPGIMPLGSPQATIDFADRCGAEVPRWLRHQLQDHAEDAAALSAFAVDFIIGLCRRLLTEGEAPGLHFYTLNKSRPTLDIITGIEDLL